eukprot:155594-Amphidinium_carterae.3
MALPHGIREIATQAGGNVASQHTAHPPATEHSEQEGASTREYTSDGEHSDCIMMSAFASGRATC